jgi:hypothetical protein|tara:strand:- start:145 stop:285 length:141 start_codon:yes stop_codon:yes gene_type:complete
MVLIVINEKNIFIHIFGFVLTYSEHAHRSKLSLTTASDNSELNVRA